MSNDLIFQAFNVLAPYRNASGFMSSQAAFVVDQAGSNIDLSQHLGGLDDGQFLTFQADGAKVYIQAAFTSTGTQADPAAQGSGPTVCWPIPDGQQLPVRVLGGRAMGSGGATMMQVATGFVIRARLALSGVATGFLRVYKSSAPSTQGLEVLKTPGWT